MSKRPLNDIGKLDKKIQIQTSVKVTGTGTSQKVSFATWKTPWAKVAQKNSWSTAPEGGHFVTGTVKEFIIRYHNDLSKRKPGNVRIKYPPSGGEARYYKVTGINLYDENDDYLVINCDGNNWEAE
jgi:head-tail adaptor